MTPRVRDEDGSAVLLGATLAAVAGVLGLLVLDLTAYLAAASRAQHAADAAALAAAAVAHPDALARDEPTAAAREVAGSWGARIDGCRCRRGRSEVEVVVSVPVRALLVTRFAGRRVSATARATMVPP